MNTFKAGDWIRSKNGNVYEIKYVGTSYFVLEDAKGYEAVRPIESDWTIIDPPKRFTRRMFTFWWDERFGTLRSVAHNPSAYTGLPSDAASFTLELEPNGNIRLDQHVLTNISD